MMDELKSRLTGITAVMAPSRPVIHLDYPVHGNVGDLLIHQGTDAFFEDHGYDVRGRFSMHDFSRLDRTGRSLLVLKESIRDLDLMLKRSGGVLVLQGGGNLGDIWPDIQAFRELIIMRYPDTPIVMLPQSVHFGNADNRARSARMFAAHKHLFLFVRDEESLHFVRESGGAGALMPDMAHYLWGRPAVASDQSHGAGTLVLRRRDRESRNNAGVPTVEFDWDDLRGAGSTAVLRALRKWQTIDNPLRHWLPNYALWRRYRDHLVQRAVDRFRPCRCIDTDRLHGMILGALMSKQVRYGEGSYGKLHRYAQLWLAESDCIESGTVRQAAE
jgi:pyruvyl transferase EpsO